MRPFTPIPRIVSGSDHSGLIARLFLRGTAAETRRIDFITTTTMRLSAIDSGHAPEEKVAEGDTWVHVLWQADEERAAIDLAGERCPIAPGDAAAIPAGDTWRLSPNQLAIMLAVRSSTLALPVLPNHGNEHFHGFNRETIYAGVGGRSPARWKLTSPLELELTNNEGIIVALYGDIAIRHDHGIVMLRRGEVSVIRPGCGRITLVPNGLTYVLVID